MPVASVTDVLNAAFSVRQCGETLFVDLRRGAKCDAGHLRRQTDGKASQDLRDFGVHRINGKRMRRRCDNRVVGMEPTRAL